MTKACRHPTCFVPEIPCALGELQTEACAEWRSSAGAGSAADAPPQAGHLGLPWTGNSFGLADLTFVAGRSSAKMVGVIGPESAGKTTLLAAWYLLLGRGSRPDGSSFAGSYTLSGWENIAKSLRWTSAGGPTFPAHTSSGAGRVPGLLHLALRPKGGQLADYLFADAPGEWFRRWAIHRDAAEAAGARWIAEHADVLLVVADTEALTGSGRGTARNVLQQLLQRVGDERDGRPVALVWSKADVEISEAMRATVRAAADRYLGAHREFLISVYAHRLGPDLIRPVQDAGDSFLDLLIWITKARAEAYQRPRAAVTVQDSFFAFGHDHR